MRKKTSTPIPVLKKEWAYMHGRATKHGALKAETDTDYLVFYCPVCNEIHPGGRGIRLEGASSDFDDLGPNEKQVLAFRFHCGSCGLLDHFKIALDQEGRYERIDHPEERT